MVQRPYERWDEGFEVVCEVVSSGFVAVMHAFSSLIHHRLSDVFLHSSILNYFIHLTSPILCFFNLRSIDDPSSSPRVSSSSPDGDASVDLDDETLAMLSRALRARAAANMDYALYLGHEPPSLLHSRGSLAMDEGEYELAIRYLEAALRKNGEERAKQDAAVTVTDGVHEASTLNQLGQVTSYLITYICLNRP